MYRLTETEVLEFVRRSIDELEDNGSSMLGVSDDKEAMDTIIAGCVVEAIIYTHSGALPSRLEGVIAETDDYGKTMTDGVVEIKMNTDTLRIVSVRSSDSPFVVSTVVAEDSPVGRMQQNKYTRGTYDNPALILASGSDQMRPTIRYYSAKDSSGAVPEMKIEYIPYPVKGSEYQISTDLRLAVLNYAVSLTLAAYGEFDKSGAFAEKAETYMK